MNNYENQQKDIEAMWATNDRIAVDKNTNKVERCKIFDCEDCLFSSEYNKKAPCGITTAKWLVSEYIEPKVDWSKVPIDTPVLVSDDGVNWERRYFVRKPAEAMFGVYSNGATSWSADGYVAWYRYAKLANEN